MSTCFSNHALDLYMVKSLGPFKCGWTHNSNMSRILEPCLKVFLSAKNLLRYIWDGHGSEPLLKQCIISSFLISCSSHCHLPLIPSSYHPQTDLLISSSYHPQTELLIPPSYPSQTDLLISSSYHPQTDLLISFSYHPHLLTISSASLEVTNGKNYHCSVSLELSSLSKDLVQSHAVIQKKIIQIAEAAYISSIMNYIYTPN